MWDSLSVAYRRNAAQCESLGHRPRKHVRSSSRALKGNAVKGVMRTEHIAWAVPQMQKGTSALIAEVPFVGLHKLQCGSVAGSNSPRIGLQRVPCRIGFEGLVVFLGGKHVEAAIMLSEEAAFDSLLSFHKMHRVTAAESDSESLRTADEFLSGFFAAERVRPASMSG